MNDIAKHIGERIRAARLDKSMSQTDLGQKIGITFQQIQKYEKGANNISVVNLKRMADALGVPAFTLLPPDFGSDAAKVVLHLEKKISQHEAKSDKLLAVLCG